PSDRQPEPQRRLRPPSRPALHRPSFPIRCQRYPPDVRLALVPFGEAALRHFMYLGTAGQMPEVFLDRPVPHAQNVTQARWDSTYCSRPSSFSSSKAEAIRTRTRSPPPVQI